VSGVSEYFLSNAGSLGYPSASILFLLINRKKRKRPLSSEAGKSLKKMIVTSKKAVSTADKKKKTTIDASPPKLKVKVAEKKSENIVVKKGSPTAEKKSDKIVVKKGSPTAISPFSAVCKTQETSNNKLKDAHLQCDQLAKNVKALYDQCVHVIKSLPENTWPRTQKKKTVKVSVKVPDNKKGGDTILFSNPHIPGQKLKVQVPDTVTTGESFLVSVPMPEVEGTDSNTVQSPKLPKNLVVALYEYSFAYDEWTQAIGTKSSLLFQTNRHSNKYSQFELIIALYRSLLPESELSKLGPFKMGAERLKKFDELVQEFPSDLIPPMQISSLRQVVRNEVKRRGRQSGSSQSQQTVDRGLHCPEKGKYFEFDYNQADFLLVL
jgi:hypothetical protein